MEVRLIAHTPDPDRVCAIAAKNCVSSKLPEDVDNMNSLVHALKGGHTSIAENATFTFSIEGISRVVEIQLVRHRVGASYAIQSGRYVTKNPTDVVIPRSVEDLMADNRENGDGYLDEVFDKYMEAVGYPDQFGDAVTQKLLHIVTTSRFESIFEIIRHGMSREEASEYIELLSRYHRTGFLEIFGKAVQ